ncbi:1879_t:CDS:2, partial [Funneliformis mosseae]
LGAVLSQLDENKNEHVIAYASKIINKAEKNYSIIDQECLAVYSHVPLITVGYQYPKNELEDIFKENIKIKQVMANQPIIKGGSQYNYSCDIGNHHIHTYCKACKRNLPYGTIEHHCIIGFSLEQIQPDMNPNYLINDL